LLRSVVYPLFQGVSFDPHLSINTVILLRMWFSCNFIFKPPFALLQKKGILLSLFKHKQSDGIVPSL
jgi:hypothetical protein